MAEIYVPPGSDRRGGGVTATNVRLRVFATMPVEPHDD
jgi:hypothetical protein